MNLLAAFISGGSLPGLLINFLITLLILGLIYWIITLLPVPPIVLTVAQVVLALILIIWLASLLTGCSSMDYDTKVGGYVQTKDGARYGADVQLNARERRYDGKTVLSE